MHEHVTLLPPEQRPAERGLSSSLPADLLEQVPDHWLVREDRVSRAQRRRGRSISLPGPEKLK